MRTPSEIAAAIDDFGKLPLHGMGHAGRRRVAGLARAILAGWEDVFADAGSETAGKVVVPFLRKAA